MCVELSALTAAVCFLLDVIGGGCVVAFLLRLLWFAVRRRYGVAGRWWCSSGASGDEVSPPATCEERWWSLLRPRIAVLTLATVLIPAAVSLSPSIWCVSTASAYAYPLWPGVHLRLGLVIFFSGSCV